MRCGATTVAADGSRPVTPAEMRRVSDDPGRLDLVGAPEGFDALVMADIVRARKGLSVFVARDGARMSAFADAFRFFATNVEVLTFPAWDCLPYDRIGPSAGVAAHRMTTLSRLVGGVDPKTPVLLVTTVPALVQRVPPKSAVQRASYSAKVADTVEVADLEAYFSVNGYQRASTVSERGEFAIRGGVIDVFPPSAEEPVRLDLFGDTLESIRAFDPESQRSTRKLTEVRLLPVSEALLDKDSISRFRSGYLQAFGAAGDDPLYATVSEGGRRAGMEHWLPLFYGRMETLFDYLPADALVALDHLSREARDERLALLTDAYEARAQAERRAHYHPLEPHRLYLTADEWQAQLGRRATRRFSAFNEADGETVIDMGARAGSQISSIGIEVLVAMTTLVLLLYAGAVALIVLYTVLIWLRVGGSYWRSVGALKEAMFVAFGTSSSFAAIPAALRGLKDGLKLDRSVVDLAMPLGITLNPPGSVFHFAIATLFLSNLYGIHLDVGQMIFVVLGAMLAGVAASGAPGIAALTMISIILVPLGLPVEVAIILLVAIDPIVDPILTVVNVVGNAAMTALLGPKPAAPAELPQAVAAE